VTIQLKCNNVYLSNHAKLRLHQRGPKIRPYQARGRIKRKIADAQRRGVKPDWDGAIHVRFDEGLWAVCYAAETGGWVVRTIYREGEKEMEEQTGYGRVENHGESIDSCWQEVMNLAQKYGFIIQAYGGMATLATHKVQKEHFGEERYLRIQKMNGLKAGEAK